MYPDIRWIEAVYGPPEPDSKNLTHVAVPETGRSALQEMADEIVGTDQLVALYVPEGTDDLYDPGITRGRIICLVQLVPMPKKGKLEDYFYEDWDGSRRWPIGWPARLICVPPVDQCPAFREHVETLHGQGAFGSYLARIQKGPFRLEPTMQERLNRDFSQFPPFSH
jgi:hypothetical protein